MMIHRNLYIDYLRVGATIAVVLWHSTSNVYYNFSPSTEWQFANIMFGFLVRWSVPCFVMISGALLLSQEEDMLHFYHKRITRIFIPLIGWTFLYGIARLYYFRVYAYGNSNAIRPTFFKFMEEQFIDLFSNDLSYHLYFVSIVLGLYLLVPFLRIMVKNMSRGQLELLLIILVAIISIKQFYPNILFVSHFQFGSSLLYFLLGHYFHIYKLKTNQRAALFIIGLICAIAMSYGNYYLEFVSGRHGDFLYQYDGIFVILISSTAFVFFKSVLENSDGEVGFLKSKISKVSKYSYGIYIAHPLAISFLWYGGGSLFSFSQWESTIFLSEETSIIFQFNGAWGAIVMTVLIFVTCWLFLYFMEKVRLLKFFS